MYNYIIFATTHSLHPPILSAFISITLVNNITKAHAIKILHQPVLLLQIAITAAQKKADLIVLSTFPIIVTIILSSKITHYNHFLTQHVTNHVHLYKNSENTWFVLYPLLRPKLYRAPNEIVLTWCECRRNAFHPPAAPRQKLVKSFAGHGACKYNEDNGNGKFIRCKIFMF